MWAIEPEGAEIDRAARKAGAARSPKWLPGLRVRREAQESTVRPTGLVTSYLPVQVESPQPFSRVITLLMSNVA